MAIAAMESYLSDLSVNEVQLMTRYDRALAQVDSFNARPHYR
jgi:hypothetical protein